MYTIGIVCMIVCMSVCLSVCPAAPPPFPRKDIHYLYTPQGTHCSVPRPGRWGRSACPGRPRVPAGSPWPGRTCSILRNIKLYNTTLRNKNFLWLKNYVERTLEYLNVRGREKLTMQEYTLLKIKGTHENI